MSNESVARAYDLLAGVDPSRWPAPIRETFASALADLTRTVQALRQMDAGTWTERVDGRCAWCRDPMPVPARPQGGGKTKLYCSDRCRIAAYWWRKDPTRNPDRQAWLARHREGLDSAG